MSAVFRRASKSRAGSAPRFGRCCAILPTRGRRALGKPRPHRANASLDRSGCAAALAHATALTTSAHVPTGLKLPFPRSLRTILSCEPKSCLSKTRRLRHVGRSNPASSRGWYRAGNAATRCRVHRPGRALVKSTITDAWGLTPGGILADQYAITGQYVRISSIGLCGLKSSDCWRIPA